MPALTEKQKKLIYDTVFGEVTGGPQVEVIAVTSTIFNRLNSPGFPKEIENVLKGYAAYSTKSKQYKKAQEGKLNAVERMIYNRNKKIIDDIINYKIEMIPGITHFENVKRFGEPPWINEVEPVGDFGRQKFYKRKKEPEKLSMQTAPYPMEAEADILNIPFAETQAPIVKDYMNFFDPTQMLRDYMRYKKTAPIYDEMENIPLPYRNPQWGGTAYA